MTVIVGLESIKHGKRAIASDGRACLGGTIVSDHVVKLRTIGNMVVGLSCDYAAFNILEQIEFADSPFNLAQTILATLREEGWSPVKEDGCPELYDVSGVIIDDNGVYEISQSMAVVPIASGFPAAAGSGSHAARSSILTMKATKKDIDPTEACRMAVRITSQSNIYCGGEITIATIDIPT